MGLGCWIGTMVDPKTTENWLLMLVEEELQNLSPFVFLKCISLNR